MFRLAGSTASPYNVPLFLSHLAQFITLTMAEPFGVAAGAIGIAAEFAACVDCFEYIQFGSHFGRYFQTDQLVLGRTRLCLARWGESVNIYDDPRLGRSDATAKEIQLAKDTLLQILVLFSSTESISTKHNVVAELVRISVFATGDMDPISIALDNRMKVLAIHRCYSRSVPRPSPSLVI
jgi:hypothetical protein